MEEVVAGRYVLGAELGRGGMARVLRARDLRLHRDVAIKLAPLAATDPAVRRRFVGEARAAAALTHPHVVAVFDAGEADGVLYLVMELVDGPALTTVLAERGRLPIEEALRYADHVLQALGAAHRSGVVHRDVKPGNVLLTSAGEAKLADFGIAKRLDDLPGDLTGAGQFVGTPNYLAPEQVAGQPATPATDLYATGVLLFEMLAGAPPFDAGSPMATALAHRDAPVPDVRSRRAGVPDQVAAAVGRAMAKDPRARFGSADEMRRALGAPPIAPTSVMPAAATPSLLTRTRSLWGVALGVAATAAAVSVALGRCDDPESTAGSTTVAATTLAPTTTVQPTTTTVPPTTTMPPTTTTVPPTTVPPVVAPDSIEDLLTLLTLNPGYFGTRSDELLRDLQRILDGQGNGRADDRLRARLDDWTADASLPPDAATIVDEVLGANRDQGDNGDDD